MVLTTIKNKDTASTQDIRHRLDDLRVYLITDRSLFAEKKFLGAVESALKGGVRALQLREKDLAPADLLALAKEVKVLTEKYGAKLFINSHADIAEKSGADGVHLTEAGVSASEVRKRFPRLLIGVSTHSLESAKNAEAEGADFITFGPVFDTPSKKQYGPAQGLGKLQEVTRSVGIPVLALGGIKLDHVPTVLDHGAFGVAMISGIWSSPNIEKSASDFMKSFRRS